MKVAILGIESSHAWDFANKIAGKDSTPMFDDVELIGVYGDTTIEGARRGVEEIKKRTMCECFAETYDAFKDKAGAVMVTARHGGLHLSYARPYLEKGTPVWLDKPICTDKQEIIELIRLAKEYHAPILGGSCLMFSKEVQRLSAYVKENREQIHGGHITAPINMANPYGDFWFYSPHLVQMMIGIFGYEVRSVAASRTENCVQAVYKYDNFSVSTFFGTGYTATVYTGTDCAESTNVTLNGCSDAVLWAFYHMVKTGKGTEDYRAFAAPVFIIEATIMAYEQGVEVKIQIPEL